MFINDEAQRQVLPIIAKTTTVSPSSDTQQRAGSLLQLNPGQQVKAEIVANLSNSLYLARIAGEMYKLEIPLNVQPGETMDMTLVAAEPRITFQLLRPPTGASVQLSSMGKWLATVVNEAPSPLSVLQTLLESPAQATSLLAGRLREALTQSGLFYESHLAQWAGGSLQLKEILKEPQGKLSRAAGGAEQPVGDDQTAAAGFADSRTLPFIKEQLLLLNSGILSWKGEAWPGQGMEIEITGREAEEGESPIEASLSLSLPRLGAVEAKVRFGADGVAVEFACDRPGSSGVLRNGVDELRLALSKAGLHLSRLAARDDETGE